MQLFFLYLAKVILTSGVMFCYYRLFLKDRTFHHYNRFYLLAVLVISLLLPLLRVDYFTVEVNSSIYLLLNKLQNIILKYTSSLIVIDCGEKEFENTTFAETLEVVLIALFNSKYNG